MLLRLNWEDVLVTRYVLEHVTPDGSYVDCSDDSADNLPHMTVYFCAHKYDTEKGDFVYMDSLDGLAIFVGEQSDNVALPAANFPGLKPDSVYFTDTIGTFFWMLEHPYYSEYDAPYGGHDIGIFNYEASCYYPCDVKSIQRILPSPMWFFPSSFAAPGGVTSGSRHPNFPYDEYVYSLKQQILFGLRNDRYLETWDLRDKLSPPRMIMLSKKLDLNYYVESKDAEEKPKRLFMPVKQLVVVDHHLLLVKRYVIEHVTPDGSYVDYYDDRAVNLPHMTVYFNAHKYDHEKGDFVYMDLLDGLTLFVGEQSDNVVLPAVRFPGLKPGSVYFTDTIGT
ncbi:hypothetical protein CASFOL_033092 [Castilleja foliolosa]|uniref:KIB1-4 beta-propeller domain-containing protein n=1 Tax=Castilleja foliolosa TaxID=1961234 RepID=A0ABD3C3C6_9LAMI